MCFFTKQLKRLATLLLFVPLAGLCQEHHDAKQLQAEALVKTLRQGGHIIYLRHAQTDRDQVDLDRSNLDNCATQRNLSQAGRAQALSIGESIRTLNIPIGKVISSPFCRCKHTAELAFTKTEISYDLRFGLGTNKQETTLLAQALKRMLATPPENKTNTVLVSHTANLKEATGIWPEPEGAAYIFRPLPNNDFQYLGKLNPETWQRLASAP